VSTSGEFPPLSFEMATELNAAMARKYEPLLPQMTEDLKAGERRLAEMVWNESCDAIGAMLEFHRQMMGRAADLADRHRFGSPPEPVANPNEAWCERYADWYYQGRG